ncbi:hypothetical protein CPB83DRAFT_892767 [Crepidotus variabilis]|uniref:Uncharacterized protein n=1 Tax=Crepidotus variabilis TaxID=179855 RepID=A0A9P6JRQ3_9AGAR|nr:hypothetical protein CPB83DRAFT_892767 [Crepidotus variabilis]
MKSTASTSDQPSTSQRPGTASRLMLTVKRTLSSTSTPKKRPVEHQNSGMLSTKAESSSPAPLHQFRDPDPSTSRPTVEQIAMGLHLSRTPHLRPTLASSPYAFPQRNAAASLGSRPYEHQHYRSQPQILPPPPSRSSMKKPSTGTTATSSSSSPMISPPFSIASGSTTTVTSVTPSSGAHSSKSARAGMNIGEGLKSRMARLLPLPHGRSSSAPTSLRTSPNGSPRSSVHHHAQQPKKAVRFNDNTEEGVGRD